MKIKLNITIDPEVGETLTNKSFKPSPLGEGS